MTSTRSSTLTSYSRYFVAECCNSSKGLDVYKHKEELPHNKYLILRLDFSTVDRSPDLTTMNASLHSMVNGAVKTLYSENPHYFDEQPIFPDCKMTLGHLVASARAVSIPVCYADRTEHTDYALD